ncbi:hypothetical protein CEE37_12655 [candidate division LCP-89 bacterium B3_LCP]|uniref:Uncharacterized protein n=1 Tax=candidate division LCP-89 bacterium B3_LCP TaxID=2012998 RepID=A0A532UTT9_UNCL8|nr:MAG: hypothetical protein CEE37_12655 [candidate division LCP-89 bacterium B3_LCP]
MKFKLKSEMLVVVLILLSLINIGSYIWPKLCKTEAKNLPDSQLENIKLVNIKLSSKGSDSWLITGEIFNNSELTLTEVNIKFSLILSSGNEESIPSITFPDRIEVESNIDIGETILSRKITENVSISPGFSEGLEHEIYFQQVSGVQKAEFIIISAKGHYKDR